jgi:hypothetical protein
LRSKVEQKWVSLYTGTLINDLLASVERAEQAATSKSCQCTPAQSGLPAQPNLLGQSNQANEIENANAEPGNSQPEKLAQPFCLSAADWNLALLFVIHAQLV